MKFNEQGDTIWTQQYAVPDTALDYWYRGVTKAVNGNGYMVVGTEDGPSNTGENDWKITLWRVDSNGTLMSTDQLGSYDFDASTSIEATHDGGYVLGGKGQSFFPIDTGSRSMVLKLDSNLNVEWVRGFTARTDTSLDDGVLYVTLTKDTNIAFATSLTDSMEASGKRVGHWAAGKLSLVGDTIWYEEFGPTIPMNSVNAIRELPDGDLVFTGWGHSFVDSLGVDRSRGFLMRLSPQGDSLWSRYLDPHKGAGKMSYHYLQDVRYSPSNGGLVMTGRFHDAKTGHNQDLWVVKTNCAGFDSLPQADFHYSKDSSKGIAFADSSRYAMERYWSFGDGYFSNLEDPDHTYPDTSSYSVTLVASACGHSDTVTKVVEPQLVQDTSTSLAEQQAGTVGIEVRPNPNDGRFSVRYQLPDAGARMTLYSMKGRQVLARELEGRKGMLRVRREGLPQGLYLLRLRGKNGKELLRKKLVVRP